MFKKIFNVIGGLIFMASAYACFLLIVVPLIHTQIQQTLTKRIPKQNVSSSMPYAKCFRLPTSTGIIDGMQKSYDHSLNVGLCIRTEAEGYMKILKRGEQLKESVVRPKMK